MSEASEKSNHGELVKGSAWEVYYPTNVNAEKDCVVLASFPMIIYFWPTLFAYILCGLLQWATRINPSFLGLVATGFWAFNLMVIVTDLDQKKFLIAMLLTVLTIVLAWVSTLKEMSVVSGIGTWISELDIVYSTQAYFFLAGILMVFLFIGLLQPRFNYWRFEPNEFVHYIQPWGRDQSVPRQGSTVTREVPDVFELILTFGGGSLVVRREGQVVARIEHIPFLSRRMIGLERLLGSTRVRHVSE